MLSYIVGIDVYPVYITYGERKCVSLETARLALLVFISLQCAPACALHKKLDMAKDSIAWKFSSHVAL